jgi:hypothetical protein
LSQCGLPLRAEVSRDGQQRVSPQLSEPITLHRAVPCHDPLGDLCLVERPQPGTQNLSAAAVKDRVFAGQVHEQPARTG